MNTQLSLFRGRLLRAAGLTLLTAPTFFACTNEIVVYEGGAGGASASSSGSGSTSGSSGTSGNSQASSGVGSTSGATTSVSAGQGGASATSVGAGGAGGAEPTTVTCFPNGGPCPDVADASAVFGACTQDDFLYIEEWLDGPLPSKDGECCYEVIANDFCGVGRPFATERGALVARATARNDWQHEGEGIVDRLDPAEREALAEAFTRDGLFEHASVASFSRFALELMAVAAPPELVRDAHLAALDEIEHARLLFALASRFAGEQVGPDKFPLTADGAVRTELAAIAAATAAEGCIGETLAAALAQAQRDAATDPAVRAALTQIAEDEARHAELAWRTVAWALRTGGDDVHAAVRDVFANARRHGLPAPSALAVPSHGLLGPDEHARIQRRILTDVIAPCAQALLAQA